MIATMIRNEDLGLAKIKSALQIWYAGDVRQRDRRQGGCDKQPAQMTANLDGLIFTPLGYRAHKFGLADFPVFYALGWSS